MDLVAVVFKTVKKKQKNDVKTINQKTVNLWLSPTEKGFGRPPFLYVK